MALVVVCSGFGGARSKCFIFYFYDFYGEWWPRVFLPWVCFFLCECLGKHVGIQAWIHSFLSVCKMEFCTGNSCGIKCFSQQRAVTWTVCADAQRSDSGRPSGPWGSPSTGNSSISTLLGLTTNYPRIQTSQLNWQDTVWEHRCWWAGNVVSNVFSVYFVIQVILSFKTDTKV